MQLSRYRNGSRRVDPRNWIFLRVTIKSSNACGVRAPAGDPRVRRPVYGPPAPTSRRNYKTNLLQCYSIGEIYLFVASVYRTMPYGESLLI
ncbi:hypothetical protein EVAR_46224_1 [Eumeta japonica]|uniref:Uncharacterized protein n=1 Tax=Eumeta variegata TaxID=151549 RepID=A0A4C1XMU5_EUMVA|nr:hypothetical protein EVAR_46224_1 [Eumeta japonica]